MEDVHVFGLHTSQGPKGQDRLSDWTRVSFPFFPSHYVSFTLKMGIFPLCVCVFHTEGGHFPTVFVPFTLKVGIFPLCVCVFHTEGGHLPTVFVSFTLKVGIFPLCLCLSH